MALLRAVHLPRGQPGPPLSPATASPWEQPLPLRPSWELSSCSSSLAPWAEPQILPGHCCPWRFAQPWQGEDCDPQGWPGRAGTGSPSPVAEGQGMNWLHPPGSDSAPAKHSRFRAQSSSCSGAELPKPPSVPRPLHQGESGKWHQWCKTEQKVLEWTGGHSWPEEPPHREPVRCHQPLSCALDWAQRTRAKGCFVFGVPATHLSSNLVISLI